MSYIRALESAIDRGLSGLSLLLFVPNVEESTLKEVSQPIFASEAQTSSTTKNIELRSVSRYFLTPKLHRMIIIILGVTRTDDCALMPFQMIASDDT